MKQIYEQGLDIHYTTEYILNEGTSFKDIESIKVYIEAIDDWINVDLLPEETKNSVIKKVGHLIAKDMS